MAKIDAARGLPEQSGPAELPDFLLYLWEWFCDLAVGRGNNGFGPSPLSYTEIEAWCCLRNIVLDDWEVSAFRSLDHTYLEVWAEKG